MGNKAIQNQLNTLNERVDGLVGMLAGLARTLQAREEPEPHEDFHDDDPTVAMDRLPESETEEPEYPRVKPRSSKMSDGEYDLYIRDVGRDLAYLTDKLGLPVSRVAGLFPYVTVNKLYSLNVNPLPGHKRQRGGSYSRTLTDDLLVRLSQELDTIYRRLEGIEEEEN